ncbi:hypothetical protein XENTR_v10024847 [Xenopus tropicalis]|nr:hypothetical protein XENTR_v10024847 [Xenopus tropicalis]
MCSVGFARSRCYVGYTNICRRRDRGSRHTLSRRWLGASRGHTCQLGRRFSEMSVLLMFCLRIISLRAPVLLISPGNIYTHGSYTGAQAGIGFCPCTTV